MQQDAPTHPHKGTPPVPCYTPGVLPAACPGLLPCATTWFIFSPRPATKVASAKFAVSTSVNNMQPCSHAETGLGQDTFSNAHRHLLCFLARCISEELLLGVVRCWGSAVCTYQQHSIPGDAPIAGSTGVNDRPSFCAQRVCRELFCATPKSLPPLKTFRSGCSLRFPAGCEFWGCLQLKR
jgi:hypothetical protein